MSTKDVELIHVRLKEELARLSLKPAVAAKMAGEGDSQGLRDVLGGRKRLSAELLAALAAQGVDSRYVLSGQRDGPAPEALTADERELLALFRAASLSVKAAAIGALQGGTGSAAGHSVRGSRNNVAGGDMVVHAARGKDK